MKSVPPQCYCYSMLLGDWLSKNGRGSDTGILTQQRGAAFGRRARLWPEAAFPSEGGL